MILRIINVNDLSVQDLNVFFDAMSEERKERCNQIRDITKRKCCIAADHLARKSVSEYLQTSPEPVQILRSEAGKPYVSGNPCYFSLSHSGELVVCAVSDKPVGVDVERIRTIDQAVATKICTEEELIFLNGIAEQETRNRALLEIWTKKEAIFKIEGKLPRKDREVNTLNPAHIDLQTSEFKGYLITVAEQRITPECCS